MSGLAVAAALMVLVVSIPLLVWHVLVFPNLDGVVQDLDWYNYDSQSQHFLYWLGFWFIAIGFGRLGYSQNGGKS